MGLYFPHMEQPKNCHSCPMCFMRFCQAGDRELTERETRPNAERPKDCPSVPVPPHGRLIDADALIDDVRRNSESYFADDFAHEWVDKATTIIPAEEAE